MFYYRIRFLSCLLEYCLWNFGRSFHILPMMLYSVDSDFVILGLCGNKATNYVYYSLYSFFFLTPLSLATCLKTRCKALSSLQSVFDSRFIYNASRHGCLKAFIKSTPRTNLLPVCLNRKAISSLQPAIAVHNSFRKFSISTLVKTTHNTTIPGGYLGIFWVGMCRPGLQIGTPF